MWTHFAADNGMQHQCSHRLTAVVPNSSPWVPPTAHIFVIAPDKHNWLVNKLNQVRLSRAIIKLYCWGYLRTGFWEPLAYSMMALALRAFAMHPLILCIWCREKLNSYIVYILFSYFFSPKTIPVDNVYEANHYTRFCTCLFYQMGFKQLNLHF